MRYFCIQLDVHNLLVDIEGDVSKHGCFITRFIEATDSQAAEETAIQSVRDDEELRELIKNEEHDPPVIEVSEFVELESLEGVNQTPGRVWYPMNPKRWWQLCLHRILNWSDFACMFAVGIGGMAVGGMIRELTNSTLPVWLALAIALLPVGVFGFVWAGEMPPPVVRVAHAVASIWYLATSIGFFALLAYWGLLARGWQVFALGALVGVVPCTMILIRIMLHTYGSNE